MTDQFPKITSLDVLAEAALFYSANQENDAQSINCSSVSSTVPKKRKHFLLDRYEAEQNSLNGADSQFEHGRLNSNSSGYSSSPMSSSPEPGESPSSASTSPVSFAGSPTAAESTSPKAKKAPKSASVSSAAKKSQTSRSKKASSTVTTPSSDASSDVSNDAKSVAHLDEFVKKVSITPKLDVSSSKSFDDLRDSVFDENVKIEVKMPKLTYTLRGMRTRKPSTKTPDHLKDEDYYAKRERNNLAARKSRNNKNAAIRTSALKCSQLENERKELDLDLGEQIMIMKHLQEKMEADPTLKERVMRLAEEKQLTSFMKVLQLK